MKYLVQLFKKDIIKTKEGKEMCVIECSLVDSEGIVLGGDEYTKKIFLAFYGQNESRNRTIASKVNRGEKIEVAIDFNGKVELNTLFNDLGGNF
jgi:hypothetical protein